MVTPSGLVAGAFVALAAAGALAVPVAVASAVRATGGGRDEMRHASILATLALHGWLVVAAALALSGFLLDFGARPPRLVFVVGPALLGVLAVAVSPLGRRLACGLPLALLLGFQAFRIPVELILWRLNAEGVVPVQMTFEGRNLDILVGLSALPMAWLAASGKLPRWGAWAWNVAGVGLLLNILAVAVLSTPYGFRRFLEGPANEVVFHWPFVWLPAFLAPLALLGHLLALRRLAAGEGA